MQFVRRNFLEQMPELNYPRSRERERETSTGCRHRFKSRETRLDSRIRPSNPAQAPSKEIFSLNTDIRSRQIAFFFFFLVVDKREMQKKSPVSRRMFSVRSIYLPLYTFSPSLSKLPSCPLKGHSVESLLYFPLLPSCEGLDVLLVGLFCRRPLPDC